MMYTTVYDSSPDDNQRVIESRILEQFRRRRAEADRMRGAIRSITSDDVLRAVDHHKPRVQTVRGFFLR